MTCSTDCIEWDGAKTDSGYGRTYCERRKRTVRAHRLAWELANHREIPAGMVVMHTCDNRLCVNPAHLKLGTQGENLKDMYHKNRQGRRDFPLGENHHTTSLTQEQVDELRATPYYRGLYFRKAKELGVSRQTVRNIYKGFTWKNDQQLSTY